MGQTFADFIDAHARQLLGSAYLLTADATAAEDLLQDALERVFIHWSRVQDPLPYTRTVMARRLTDGWRATRRHPRHEPLELLHHDLAASDTSQEQAERADMTSLLRQLPPRQRAVIVLRYYEDRSEAEIAEALDITSGTVKSQAAKALRTLRRLSGEPTDPSYPGQGQGQQQTTSQSQPKQRRVQ